MRNFILNGQGHGPVGEAYNAAMSPLSGRSDPGMLRPFIESDPTSPHRGRPCVELQTTPVYNNAKKRYEPRKKKYLISELQARGINSPVFNAVVYTRDEWSYIDRKIMMVPRQPLVAYSDLIAANRVGGFDAWTAYSYEYAAMGDSGESVKDMDATSEGRDDTGLNLLRSVPLAVIHSDMQIAKRLLDATRAKGMPLDTTELEQRVRRNWEMVERTAVGTETGMTWGTRSTGPFPITGTSTEYGWITFPYRVTKTDLTVPTGSNPEAIFDDINEMVETMVANGYAGPFMLYHSTAYSKWLKSDYFRTGGTSANTTVRQRILDGGDIQDIRRLNYLTSGYQLILADLSTGQFGAIDGMQPQTVQWSERGGYIEKLMTLMIQVPLFKAPSTGIAAEVHGTTTP